MKRHIGNTCPDARFTLSLARVYLLHYAAKAPVSCTAMANRLRKHGISLNARSIAQLLRGLRANGYVEPAEPLTGDGSSIAFRATLQGRAVLERARGDIETLFRKLATASNASVRRLGLCSPNLKVYPAQWQS